MVSFRLAGEPHLEKIVQRNNRPDPERDLRRFLTPKAAIQSAIATTDRRDRRQPSPNPVNFTDGVTFTAC